MKQEYIITNEELAQKGLDLNNYATSGVEIPAIINRALEIAVSRISDLCDNIKGDYGVEKFLDEHTEKVRDFKKLQYNILWNAVFTGEKSPVDRYIDVIITHEMECGKINGIQKGLYYSNR